jgi:hypothetical protein
MRAIFRTLRTTVGLAVFAATLAPSVFAGCGEIPGKAAPAGSQPQSHLVQAAYRPAQFVLVDDDPTGSQIVGLWYVNFTLPDGVTQVDWGYAQWHSDGTEIMNSGGRPPVSGNFCMGVWKRTGSRSYKLNHIGLSWNGTGTAYVGPASIQEQVTLDHAGNTFSGTFTIVQYATDGHTILGQVAGLITGQRVTAD